MQNKMIITIDGPSGVGKGTLAQMLAERLGWHFLDSGALYRIVAYAALGEGLDESQIPQVIDLMQALKIQFKEDPQTKTMQVFLDAQNITQKIREESISQWASKFGAHLEIRKALDDLQRSFIQPPGLVADGRDMGTEIFPEAFFKFFLTASPEERARRRFKQLQAKGIHVNMPDLLADIEERDHRDATRKFRPLRPAENATVIDTSAMSIEQVFNFVWERLDF